MDNQIIYITKTELETMIESVVRKVIEQKFDEIFKDIDNDLEIHEVIQSRLFKQKQAVLHGERGRAFEDVIQELG